MAPGIPTRLTAGEGRRFALTVGGALLGLGGLMWWRGRVQVAALVAGLGGLLVVAGLVVPTQLTPVYRGWMALGEALSRITTPLFLALVYFVALTPVGLLMRLAGRRPLHRAARASTRWVTRDVEARQRRDMQRQF